MSGGGRHRGFQVPQAVAAALDVENVTVVKQQVQDGGRQPNRFDCLELEPVPPVLPDSESVPYADHVVILCGLMVEDVVDIVGFRADIELVLHRSCWRMPSIGEADVGGS